MDLLQSPGLTAEAVQLADLLGGLALGAWLHSRGGQAGKHLQTLVQRGPREGVADPREAAGSAGEHAALRARQRGPHGAQSNEHQR